MWADRSPNGDSTNRGLGSPWPFRKGRGTGCTAIELRIFSDQAEAPRVSYRRSARIEMVCMLSQKVKTVKLRETGTESYLCESVLVQKSSPKPPTSCRRER